MNSFKPVTMAAIALLAVAAPAQAGKSDAGGEVTLHIDADAAIAPDRAEMTLPLTGKGASRDEALRDYAAKQESITSALASNGIDKANIKTSEAKDDKDAAINAMADASHDAEIPNPTAKPRTKPATIVAVSGSMTITIDDLSV